MECSFILSEGTSPNQARCFQSKSRKRLEVRNPNRQRAEERMMVVPAFVPRHKVRSGGNGAGCCFHLSFDNFNATTTLSAVKHCYHGHRLCASKKITFLKVNQDMIKNGKPVWAKKVLKSSILQNFHFLLFFILAEISQFLDFPCFLFYGRFSCLR